MLIAAQPIYSGSQPGSRTLNHPPDYFFFLLASCYRFDQPRCCFKVGIKIREREREEAGNELLLLLLLQSGEIQSMRPSAPAEDAVNGR